MAPMMLAEETGRAMMNVPYYGRQAGQNAAQFVLADSTEGRVVAGLNFVSNASAGFLGAGAMVPGTVSMGAPVLTAQEMAVAHFPGLKAMNDQIWSQRQVLTGHGGLPVNETFVVPKGTSITFYAEPGAAITNGLGSEVERATVSSSIYRRTYGPGDVAPNPNLGTIPDSWVSQQPVGTMIRVDQPAPLSELLGPNMGVCHWAACMSNSSLPGAQYLFTSVGKVKVK